jgi:hypothetical protein
MVRDDEAYIHFQECLTSLNNAWTIICKLQETKTDGLLHWAAYRMALIEYAKPFKTSKGAARRHRLSAPPFSEADVSLHRELIDLRDRTLAHSDLTTRDAKVYVGRIAGQPFPLIVSNTDQTLPTLDNARGLIERTLDYLYSQTSNYEKQFEDVP